MVVVDTNIIIDHLRTVGEKDSYFIELSKNLPKDSLAISIATVQELYQGRSTRNLEQEKNLIATIAPLKILHYTYQIAKLAGQISRDTNGMVEFVDAAIAATTILNDAELFTLDRKDFHNIKGLVLYSRLDSSLVR